MSGRRSRTSHALDAAAEGRSRSLVPYALSSAAEGRRRSLAPYAPRSLASRRGSAYTQPPEVDPRAPTWPLVQRTRDNMVHLHMQRLVGLQGPFTRRYGGAEPEARLVAAAFEAESFAAASEYASGLTLATYAERFEVHRTYCKENGLRLIEFFKSRAAASSGGVRKLGDSPATPLLLDDSDPED